MGLVFVFFAKMAEGTKSLYLSAALYFSANFVTVTNQKLVADPRITEKLFDGDKYLNAPIPSHPQKHSPVSFCLNKHENKWLPILWLYGRPLQEWNYHLLTHSLHYYDDHHLLVSPFFLC